MTEMKFTPGPWEVDFENCHAGQVATCYGDGEGHYEVWSRSWMEHGIDQKANAHLISAAPALYEALEWAMRFVEQVRAESPAPKGGGEDIAYRKAQAALAKARGGVMKSADMPIIPTWKSAGDMSKSDGGLTKREYFAAMAMQGLCNSEHMREVATEAQLAIAMADALLAELDKEAS